MNESPDYDETENQLPEKVLPKINTKEAMFDFIAKSRYAPAPASRPPGIMVNIYKPGTFFVVSPRGSELIESNVAQEQLEQWCKKYMK